MVAKFLFVLMLLCAAPALAVTETVEMISVSPGITLETTIFRPNGSGPFPLAVINHGKAIGSPKNQTRERLIRLTNEFLKRGYAVVLPMRQSFSKSSGDFGEVSCDMLQTGILQANDVKLSIEYFSRQPWIDKQRIVVIGQSFGGLTSVALGSTNHPGVKGIINFAGGLKYHGGFCDWQGSLVNAMRVYGTTAKVPSIWFYGKTDGHFPPELATKMAVAYTDSGAPLIYVPTLRCSFSNDSHSMVTWKDGVPCYILDLVEFLKSINMPFEERLNEDLPDPN